VSSCASCCYLELDPTCPFGYPACSFVYPAFPLKAIMSGEPSELEKSVEEVLKKLMVDRMISEGIQDSSTRGL
jgi:hypothetical protein